MCIFLLILIKSGIHIYSMHVKIYCAIFEIRGVMFLHDLLSTQRYIWMYSNSSTGKLD